MAGNIILIEPFYGGSHKQLVDRIVSTFQQDEVDLYTIPAKKWHWRARTAASYFAEIIPEYVSLRGHLFCSSVLNLTELLGLRPDLNVLHKILYFHENQLIYPVQDIKKRDFQYGYNQLVSCITADEVLFNSKFNLDSFINNISKFIKIQPDFRPKQFMQKIQPKCKVLYYPLVLPPIIKRNVSTDYFPHIVWPHRWEHDKDPEQFFTCLMKLADDGIEFSLSVLGESYREVPAIFEKAKSYLKSRIIHWGYVESKDEYNEILSQCHIVISTAKHEFFGVAMLEAVARGCFPLCPNALVYPELYPQICLYSDMNDLYEKLCRLCGSFEEFETTTQLFDSGKLLKYSWENLRKSYENLFKQH